VLVTAPFRLPTNWYKLSDCYNHSSLLLYILPPVIGTLPNPGAADRLLDEIEEKLSLLADNPQLGPARSDIAEDCRYVPVGNYLILYRIIPAGIEVVRVVQGSRRLENLFP
jgi:toxin ParE1/3/4